MIRRPFNGSGAALTAHSEANEACTSTPGHLRLRMPKERGVAREGANHVQRAPNLEKERASESARIDLPMLVARGERRAACDERRQIAQLSLARLQLYFRRCRCAALHCTLL
ncbi:hypothetical protein M758_4G002400 [Ceratodon purpureus]|uniref:Uncharacterized protein n=1 Tax=Ceratodon purpureus TaxID=3225 RepID=A0A8T0I503_CERPU|nr:hypothetical protein KC19_4G002500 [Ceratodon purpureus]KAG0617611.1 hypothetical protein M758_4G002400 [Ceratodon purpureus]